MKTNHKIVTGDSRNLSLIDDESVHLIITSPPYWQLKDYGFKDQIGFDDSYESYINNLNLVWDECNRVLHPGCRLCINIGDQFARSVYYGRYKVIPIRTEIIRFCETIGLDYMGAIIWQKVTTTNTTGGASVMGSYPYPRNGILKLDYEFILLFKKLGKAPKPTAEQKEKSKLSNVEWNKYFSGHWNFGGAKQDGHIAMFPEELPARLIKMFSFTGDTVFDPFLGSGTTTLAARNLERNSIGYEINPEFIEIAKAKLEVDQPDLVGTTYTFLSDLEFNKSIKSFSDLPYIFKDHHKFDKKVDPKKLQFGSKIDNNASDKDELYSVTDVISPELIKLNNNLTVRLIGIKTNESSNGDAIEFLLKKTKGKKVFLKFDEKKFDEKNNLLCYLYLKNKTFLNAHLIKSGLAEVETNSVYRYKDRFLKLRG